MGDFYMGNTYLFKKNASLNDIPSLISELAKIKEGYPQFIKDDIKSKFVKDAQSTLVFDGIHGLAGKIEKDSLAYEKGLIYDYSLDLSVYFNNNRIVVGAFGGNSGLSYFKDHFSYPSYDYCAYTESDEELPEDWEERGDFWDSIFSETGIPSKVSLAYNIYDANEVPSLCWDLFNELVRKE